MSWPLEEGALIFEKRYRVGPPLGSGAFGSAYTVTRVSDARVAVAKQFGMRWDITFDPDHERAEWEARARFELEMSFSAKSRHLIQGIESAIHADHMHLIIEHGGRTITDHVKTRGRPVTSDDVVNWIGQALYGLRDIVAAGYTAHRDVCPPNVLISPCELLKRADFGAVKVGGSATGTPASRKWDTIVKIVGHPNFAAPELLVTIFGEPTVKCDVFSLGVLAYHLLSGEDYPFATWSSLDAGVMLFSDPAIRAKPLPSAGAASGLTSSQRGTLHRMLSYRPDDRPLPEEALLQLGGTGLLFFRCLRPGCDGRIAYGSSTCAACGMPLDDRPVLEPGSPRAPVPHPVSAAALDVARTGRLVLRVPGGPLVFEVPRGAVVRLGRASIMAGNRYVSRDHGRLWEAGGEFLIEDHGSTNGILVDGSDLSPRTPRVLRGGESLQVGDVVGEFTVDADARVH